MAQLARALALGARGRRFESSYPDKTLDLWFGTINNGYMPITDKDKAREYQRLYHLRTWEKRKARHKVLRIKRKRELARWLRNLKHGKSCEICKEKYPLCLDFHHKDPKDKLNSVSDLVIRGYAREVILKEIDKCIVLCKNCHVKQHYKESSSGIS